MSFLEEGRAKPVISHSTGGNVKSTLLASTHDPWRISEVHKGCVCARASWRRLVEQGLCPRLEMALLASHSGPPPATQGRLKSTVLSIPHPSAQERSTQPRFSFTRAPCFLPCTWKRSLQVDCKVRPLLALPCHRFLRIPKWRWGTHKQCKSICVYHSSIVNNAGWGFLLGYLGSRLST